MTQFNNLPNFPTPLIEGKTTSKDWFFFFAGLFKGLPPEKEIAVTPGASPYTYQPTKKGTLIVNAGTVSAVEFSRDGVTYYTVGTTAGMFTLNAYDYLRITYAVAPTVTFVPT